MIPPAASDRLRRADRLTIGWAELNNESSPASEYMLDSPPKEATELLEASLECTLSKAWRKSAKLVDSKEILDRLSSSCAEIFLEDALLP